MLASLQFQQPLWFLLFILILLVLILLWRGHVQAVSDAGQGIIATHLARIFSLQGSKKLSLQPLIFTLITTGLLITAIAGPQVNLAGEKKYNAPLIIALDLSNSMASEQPSGVNHLQRSKLIITQLLEQGFNRPVSLIAFAGSAHQVLPVSEQLNLLRLYLDYLAPSVMPVQGDDLNQLLTNINEIKEAKQFGYDVLIISDGFSVDENVFKTQLHNNNALLLALNDEAAEQAQSLNVQVLTGKYLDSGDTSLYQRLTKLADNNKSTQLSLTNVGYWLLYPVLLLGLYFFRRGFNLHWAAVFLVAINFTPTNAHAAFIDWWLTPDQQGAYYFEKQNYKEAASRFEDKNWQAASYVYAKEYSKAAAIYQQQDDLTSLFNLAVTNAKGRNYHRAQKLFQLILEIEPENNDARNSLRIITSLMNEIQATAEKQQEEEPPNEQPKSSDMVDEQLGANRDQIGQREVKLEGLSADELLGSEQKKEQWLRDISRDPKLFLGAKFQAQYNKQLQQGGSDE